MNHITCNCLLNWSEFSLCRLSIGLSFAAHSLTLFRACLRGPSILVMIIPEKDVTWRWTDVTWRWKDTQTETTVVMVPAHFGSVTTSLSSFPVWCFDSRGHVWSTQNTWLITCICLQEWNQRDETHMNRQMNHKLIHSRLVTCSLEQYPHIILFARSMMWSSLVSWHTSQGYALPQHGNLSKTNKYTLQLILKLTWVNCRQKVFFWHPIFKGRLLLLMI